MDRSSFGSALDGSDLGGNEVQAVRMVSVSHRSEAEGIVTAKTARVTREAIAWGPDESVVLSRPAEPGASSSSASARFDSSFADFWFVASCVSPFAEAGARYRVASSTPMAGPKGFVARVEGSAAREPARECWAFRWCEQSRRLNAVPTKTALRVVPKQGVVRLFIPKPGMTSTRVSFRRDVSSWRQVRERRGRTTVPRSCASVLTERRGPQKTSRSWKESTAGDFERGSAPEVMFDGVSTPLEGVPRNARAAGRGR